MVSYIVNVSNYKIHVIKLKNKGWLQVRSVHSDIIQFRGSHYDYGYMQGEHLKNSLIIKNRHRDWRLRRPRFTIDEAEAKQAFMRFAPGIWEELLGLRDALQQPMSMILRDFGNYRVQPVYSGCSILTGKDYMIRNYDYHPKTYEGRYNLFQPTDGGYAVIGPSQRVTGRMDGMNEKGLVMGYNFMHRKDPGDGFICHMIGRIILEMCATTEEAIELVKEIPHRTSFSYIVLDEKEETYVIEATPRSVQVHQSNVCTNHFEVLQHENRRFIAESQERLNAINNQKAQATDAYKAFRLLNDTDKGVFVSNYKSWSGTLHTSAYFPTEKQAWIALGGDQEPVKIDFESWLSGKNLERSKIFGEIDTSSGFAHMDENPR